MRVITGSARGRRLKELEGMETRPTTDRVKEGLFNVLQFDIEGRKVLDLFAGTCLLYTSAGRALFCAPFCAILRGKSGKPKGRNHHV